jgi:hypothetical protein
MGGHTLKTNKFFFVGIAALATFSNAQTIDDLLSARLRKVDSEIGNSQIKTDQIAKLSIGGDNSTQAQLQSATPSNVVQVLTIGGVAPDDLNALIRLGGSDLSIFTGMALSNGWFVSGISAKGVSFQHPNSKSTVVATLSAQGTFPNVSKKPIHKK